MFIRRLGLDPHREGTRTVAAAGCPDIWEVEDGGFAVIGVDITDQVRGRLPATANCGPDERVVWVSRETLVLAKRDIPDVV